MGKNPLLNDLKCQVKGQRSTLILLFSKLPYFFIFFLGGGGGAFSLLYCSRITDIFVSWHCNVNPIDFEGTKLYYYFINLVMSWQVSNRFLGDLSGLKDPRRLHYFSNLSSFSGDDQFYWVSCLIWQYWFWNAQIGKEQRNFFFSPPWFVINFHSKF